jgi:hypothetical protein
VRLERKETRQGFEWTLPGLIIYYTKANYYKEMTGFDHPANVTSSAASFDDMALAGDGDPKEALDTMGVAMSEVIK